MFIGESPAKWLWLTLLFPLAWFHGEWLDIVVQEIDHCQIAQCDFVRHYAPQAQELTTESPQLIGGWFYPPLLATLLVPFLWFGKTAMLWFIFNVCALLGMCWCCVRFAKSSWWISLLVCMQCMPVLHSLKWGQVSLILSTLLIWAVFGASERVRSGVIALCSAMKLYPMVLMIPALLDKRWKEMGWAVVLFLLFCLFPCFLIGWDFSLLMWENVVSGARKVRAFASDGGGQSLYPVLNRLFHDGAHTQGLQIHGGLLTTISALSVEVLYAIVMCLLLVQSKRTYVSFSGRVEKTLFLWVTMHLFLSPGWHHYMSFLPFVLLWCRTKEKGFSFSTVGLMCICLPVLLLGHVEGVYVEYSSWGGTFWALLFAWIALCRIARDSLAYQNQTAT